MLVTSLESCNQGAFLIGFPEALQNRVKSCDSDDDTPMSIAALGDEKRKLLYFCSYSFLFGIPREHRDVLYIVGKIFLKELQRRQDRAKHFTTSEQIQQTSFIYLVLKKF